jgi:CheY-like chemotaxis protein/HPt (histidine-containing phosphotransfer) domain-containing protein
MDLMGKRVLIVDDNATNRTIIEHYLTHWGCIVGQAYDGLSALQMLYAALQQNQPYDLALLDLHMPVMDGLTLARNLSASPEFSRLARIMLTSGGLISEDERRSLGLAQGLLKPARQTQLFDAIVNALNNTEPAVGVKSAGLLSHTVLADYHANSILIVEDNKVNQKVIIGMLVKFKITPDIAENGQLALDKLAEKSYDVVFMDCQMPIMDGYQATRETRRIENEQALARQTIIALTAHASQGEREKCLAVGMDDYLVKPFTQDKLADILARWLPTTAMASKTTPLTESPITTHYWDKTIALNFFAHDEALLNDMMVSFLEEAPLHVDALQHAQRSNNKAALADAAHSLKGLLGYFGAERAWQCASDIENHARQMPEHDNQVAIQTLTDIMTALQADFRDYLKEID